MVKFIKVYTWPKHLPKYNNNLLHHSCNPCVRERHFHLRQSACIGQLSVHRRTFMTRGIQQHCIPVRPLSSLSVERPIDGFVKRGLKFRFVRLGRISRVITFPLSITEINLDIPMCHGRRASTQVISSENDLAGFVSMKMPQNVRRLIA